jgi:hypothetical protein
MAEGHGQQGAGLGHSQATTARHRIKKAAKTIAAENPYTQSELRGIKSFLALFLGSR